MNKEDELEEMWEEVATVCSVVESQTSVGGTEETHRSHSQDWQSYTCVRGNTPLATICSSFSLQ